MRRIAVLSGLVLVGGLLGPSTAIAADEGHPKGDDTRWIAVEDAFAVVLPDGETFTGEEDPGPLDGSEPPPVGTQLFISEVLYATDDGETAGDEVGRSHIQCTAQAVELTFRCDGALVFDDGSQLFASVVLDFTMEPETFDIAVFGGTGDFFGVTGALTLTDMSTDTETAALYEADLVHPHD